MCSFRHALIGEGFKSDWVNQQILELTFGNGAVGSLCLATPELCLRCVLGFHTATPDTWRQCHGQGMHRCTAAFL